jgi:hypothetical protein
LRREALERGQISLLIGIGGERFIDKSLILTDASADRACSKAAEAEVLESDKGGLVKAQIHRAPEHGLLFFVLASE